MRKNGQKIHTNVLIPSHPDIVTLGQAVEERFLNLCGSYLRIRGVELVIPRDYDSDMYLWRTMRVRHMKGDYRNTIDEKKSTRRIAEWTHKVNCALRNQDYVPFEWSD